MGFIISELISKKNVLKLLLITMLLSTISISAQETTVVGQVLNKTDKSPLSNVSVYFKNSDIVVHTDEEGNFLIHTTGNYNTVIFSCIGFQKEQIKLKPGQSLGIQVELTEKNTFLQEVFVISGANPALELMKKVRLMRKENDISWQKGFSVECTEQNMVLLDKVTQQSVKRRIFEQLKKGNVSGNDSSLVLPLYMAENKYKIVNTDKKKLSQKIFSSSENDEQIIAHLTGDISSVRLNFYNNAITLFDNNIISPLSNIGNSYYSFFLADSLTTDSGKQFEVHFRTKNSKNLAFNGELWIDSATLALTRIDAELPADANINFVHNLHISQNFVPIPNKHWQLKNEELALSMNYQLLADSLNSKPEILIKRSASYNLTNAVTEKPLNFAQSNYSQESLNDRMNELSNTPVMHFAKWLADIAFTGYVPVGKIDVGKIQQVARLSEIEGLRLTLPLRTNERLWKNVSLGGYAGYCFRNEAVKYSSGAQFKLPGEKKRTFGLNYTNDYRRIDYNYNNFLYLENPLVTGDEDIVGTLFSLSFADKMNERKELEASFSNDWNQEIESHLYLRSIEQIGNSALPLQLNGVNVFTLNQQSATFSTRFSFDQKTYEDHLQRIYIPNHKPIIYSILEVGKYQFANKNGSYAKISGLVKQNLLFELGKFNYIAEATCILGRVPYPLLRIPAGNEGGCSFYMFNMMNNMEYAADKYISLHSELIFNGLIMNHIPLINKMNMRELFAFKMAYGSLGNSHKSVADYPAFLNPLSKPYAEVGVGLTNIFRILTVQSVWRLTDLHHSNVIPWGIYFALRISF